MQLSLYIKKYLLNDIILLLIISGISYLMIDKWNKNNIEDETTVELVPINEYSEDELG